MDIEQFFWRFPIIGEQILKGLDFDDLANCAKVSKSWRKFIVSLKIIPQHIASSLSIENPNSKSIKNLQADILQDEKIELGDHLPRSIHFVKSRTKSYFGEIHEEYSKNQLIFGASKDMQEYIRCF